MTRPSPTEIAVRCLTEKPGSEPMSGKKKRSGLDQPSEYALIFDCETTIDAAQALRVGFFQVCESGALVREGLFFDEDTLTDADIATILAFGETNCLEVLSADEFRADVFLQIGYRWRGSIVGFNLPFDISRIAIGHGEARKHMRGGFSFPLTPNKYDPKVRVKHLSRRAALIDFAKPAIQTTGRSGRKRGEKVPHNRGYFYDIKTLAASLTSRSFSLGSLCEFLGTQTQKRKTEEHGGPITPDYLDYARADVQATWECYEALTAMYVKHGLDKPAHRILSEASVGKAYLDQMGIEPLLACQPDIDRSIFGKTMCGYYGGRAEVRIRREVREVIYVDFKSMYPTVNSLMGLWDFVIADGMSWHDTTTETQEFLNRVTDSDLQKPDTWLGLRTIVRIKPDGDVLPVRAKYDGNVNTIGLNHLSSDHSLWYTLADCVASKLLTGKTPTIIEAITFKPGPSQKGLKPVDLFGNPAYRVDPIKHDVFNRLIDLRDEAKSRNDPIEKAIKIIANATSYGIFIEIIRDNAAKPELLFVYGINGDFHELNTRAIEEPGKYFNPLLGVLITGAARLMLALAEIITIKNNLEWVFCDTDSLAIAKPKEINRNIFIEKANAVIDWFIPLNPYKKPGSILQIEDINFGNSGKNIKPLYCYAISAKRYCLFNKDNSGKPILRKASAHGLGHLIEPYSDKEALPELPKPQYSLPKIGVKRWQHDLWIKIIEAALAGHPDQVSYDWHPALQKPALSRYSATSPDLLGWMKHWNEGKPYSQQIRPFGFLVAPMAKKGLLAEPSEAELVDPSKRGRPAKAADPKPIAPFETDPARAVAQAFDRVTGDPIDPRQLKTYAEALFNYHLSSEDKFENGEFLDRGKTARRHIRAESVRLIGKEANKVGESGEADPLECNAVASFQTTRRFHPKQNADVAHLPAGDAAGIAATKGKRNPPRHSKSPSKSRRIAS